MSDMRDGQHPQRRMYNGLRIEPDNELPNW